MTEIEQEERSSVRVRMARESGYTGLSILHRLHPLYGFDVCRDLVIDVMHNLPLNVVKHHLRRLLEEEVVQPKDLEQLLREMPWTTGETIGAVSMNQLASQSCLFVLTELKDGRLPTDVTTRLGFWKAEEFKKFGFPAAECILPGLVEEDEQEIWLLLARIMELVFTTGRAGFSDDSIKLLSNLIKRHNVLVEETHGIQHPPQPRTHRRGYPAVFLTRQLLVFLVRASSPEIHLYFLQLQNY